jgi:hypothetical protein
MVAIPFCIACNIERTLVGVSPAARRHDIHAFECQECRTVLRLVVARDDPHSTADASSDLQSV